LVICIGFVESQDSIVKNVIYILCTWWHYSFKLWIEKVVHHCQVVSTVIICKACAVHLEILQIKFLNFLFWWNCIRISLKRTLRALITQKILKLTLIYIQILCVSLVVNYWLVNLFDFQVTSFYIIKFVWVRTVVTLKAFLCLDEWFVITL
jgi:hypothetical protein